MRLQIDVWQGREDLTQGIRLIRVLEHDPHLLLGSSTYIH